MNRCSRVRRCRESPADCDAQRLVRGWPVHRVYATHVVHHVRSLGVPFRRSEAVPPAANRVRRGLWRVLAGRAVDCLHDQEPASPTSTSSRFPERGEISGVEDGGSHPVWRPDGKELFYLGPDATLMAVPIGATGQFDFGPPQALFPTAVPDSIPAGCTPSRRTANGSWSLPGLSGPAWAADRGRQLDGSDPASRDGPDARQPANRRPRPPRRCRLFRSLDPVTGRPGSRRHIHSAIILMGMARTQIQLPDQVYARARRVAKGRRRYRSPNWRGGESKRFSIRPVAGVDRRRVDSTAGAVG